MEVGSILIFASPMSTLYKLILFSKLPCLFLSLAEQAGTYWGIGKLVSDSTKYAQFQIQGEL
jgi:hypothetical protein